MLYCVDVMSKRWADLGAYLRTLREQRRPPMSGPQLAERMGVHRSLVHKVETGVRRPSEEYLERAAPELRVDATTLLERAGYRVLKLNRVPAADAPSNGDVYVRRPADPLLRVHEAIAEGGWAPEIQHGVVAMLSGIPRHINSSGEVIGQPSVAPMWITVDIERAPAGPAPRQLPATQQQQATRKKPRDLAALVTSCGWEPETIAQFEKIAASIRAQFGAEGEQRLADIMEDAPRVAAHSPPGSGPRQIKVNNERALLRELCSDLGAPWPTD